jgi:hypothetical protein
MGFNSVFKGLLGFVKTGREVVSFEVQDLTNGVLLYQLL